MCVRCLSACVPHAGHVRGSQKKVSDPLGVTYRCLWTMMSVRQIEPRFPGRLVGALNHRPSSSAPRSKSWEMKENRGEKGPGKGASKLVVNWRLVLQETWATKQNVQNYLPRVLRRLGHVGPNPHQSLIWKLQRREKRKALCAFWYSGQEHSGPGSICRTKSKR